MSGEQPDVNHDGADRGLSRTDWRPAWLGGGQKAAVSEAPTVSTDRELSQARRDEPRKATGVGAAAIPTPASIVELRPLRQSPAAIGRTCNHADPMLNADVGADGRGWIETRCRDCGGFIGYRLPG